MLTKSYGSRQTNMLTDNAKALEQWMRFYVMLSQETLWLTGLAQVDVTTDHLVVSSDYRPSRQQMLHTQISTWYYHHDLQRLIGNYHCDHCQCNKLDDKWYGHLPEHKIRSIPFKEFTVDLIGPWMIQVQDKPYEFNALTMTNTVSNLVIRIDD